MANLLVDITSTTSGSSPGTWGTVPDLSASNITVQGTNSVLLLIAQVQIAAATDNTAEFRFTVNGSATGSPVITCFSDATNGETQSMTLVWAVDGLSGSANSFSVEWQTVTGSPSIDTARPHTFQIIEIANGEASIKVDQSSTAAASAPASWGNLFSATGVSIAGTSSVILMLSNVPITMATDAAADFQFSVDTTREGAVTSQFTDAANEGSGWSGMHALDGLSAGNHSFELQWQIRQGSPSADTGRLRTFQVVEVTQKATLKLDLSSTASASAPSSWGDVTGLSGSYSVTSGAMALVIGNMQMADNGTTDTACDFRLAIDSAGEGAVLTAFSDEADGVGRACLAWAETGLSAASHDFSMQWQLIQSTPSADTGRTRTLFAIEFVVQTYKLEGVTKDKNGNTLGSCKCFLCKDNQDNTASFIAYTTSDGSGNYSFTGIGDNDAQYFVISWKDDTPHVFDVTDHVLQPVEE